jgi:two-component system, chemotaxis family, sensor kinase CheA
MNQDRLAARLRATFAAELADQVRLMNRDLLALESDPVEPATLKSLFRVAHTLKGAARTADVPLVEEVCHNLETLLVEARDGSRRLGPADFKLLFEAADALAEAGERLKAERPVGDSALSQLAARLRAGRLPAESAPVASTPPQAAPTAPAHRADQRDDRVRIDPARLDSLLAASNQLLIAGGRLAERPREVEAVHDSAKELLAGWRRARRQLRADPAMRDDPRVSEVVEWVDARVQTLVQQARRLSAALATDARALEQVTGPMLDQVRRLRVRPIGEACESLPRAARDLAAAAGKELALEIADGGVEADRAVLDALSEALLQLLRNAVDHGIEAPARREQLGKPRRGSIRVAAALRGDRIVVTIADDGAGLDEATIRARLAARGRPEPATRHELVRALLEGGTSTRSEAGKISGRGVGLDIVRAAVERIHGRMEVDWDRGRGTTFTLVCPPSPASIRALLVRVGPETIAVPTADIAMSLIVPAGDVRRAAGRNTVATPAGPVPLVPLSALLGAAFAGATGNGKIRAVVVGSGARRVALAVDELVAEQEIVLRPVPGKEGRFPLLNGAALLASGRVALVLDTAAVVEAAGAAAVSAGTESAGAPVTGQSDGARKLRVLVVEDSITTRTLEQSILEAAGYEVATAVDGVDGLRWLQERPCDLVVADVDMPRMDGLALCRAVRASPQLKALPFVLVTARESAEDRARGLEAGADAYLGKSSFDQQGLLETIRQLIG